MSGLPQGTCLSNLKSVSVTMLEQLSFDPPKRGSCVPGHALFSENFKGIMSGVSLGTCLSNLKSVTLTVFEQLAFITPKNIGDRYPWYAPFLKKKFMSGLSQGTCFSNLKSVSVSKLYWNGTTISRPILYHLAKRLSLKNHP